MEGGGWIVFAHQYKEDCFQSLDNGSHRETKRSQIVLRSVGEGPSSESFNVNSNLIRKGGAVFFTSSGHTLSPHRLIFSLNIALGKNIGPSVTYRVSLLLGFSMLM